MSNETMKISLTEQTDVLNSADHVVLSTSARVARAWRLCVPSCRAVRSCSRADCQKNEAIFTIYAQCIQFGRQCK